MLPSLLFTSAKSVNNGILVYQFASELLHLFQDVVVVSDWNKNIGGSTDLAKKDTDLHTPIHPPPPPPLPSPVNTRMAKRGVFIRESEAASRDDVIFSG